MTSDHQQDTDALHDVEGYVPILGHRVSIRAARDIIFRRMFTMDNPGRVADHDGMGRHVEIHEGKRGDQDIVPDRDVSDDTGVAPDPDPVANHRIAFPFPPEFHADGDALVQGAVLSDDGLIVDGDIAAMDQDEAFADPRMPTNLDSRSPGTTPEHPSEKKGMPAVLVQPEPEDPAKIRFPNGRVQQSPEPFSSVVSVQICECDIGDEFCHYA